MPSTPNDNNNNKLTPQIKKKVNSNNQENKFSTLEI